MIKKRRRNSRSGTGQTAEVFVTRLPPELTQEDLSAYILAILNLNATVFKQQPDTMMSFRRSMFRVSVKIQKYLWIRIYGPNIVCTVVGTLRVANRTATEVITVTMADSLHITSYNCRGLLKTLSKLYVRPDIIGLFDIYDLIFFEETWLAKQYLDNCNSLHPNYFSVNVAAVDYSSGLLKGRPHGGVSIFYHRRLSSSVKPLYFANSDWCVGIDLTVENTSFSLINVYLPYEIELTMTNILKNYQFLKTSLIVLHTLITRF